MRTVTTVAAEPYKIKMCSGSNFCCGRAEYSGMRCSKERRSCLCRCVKITLLILLVVLILLFLLIFVGIPVAFMCSIKFQTFLVFMNIDQPSNPEYENFAKYNVHGVRNMYTTVKDINTDQTVSLGVWHFLPEELVDKNIANSDHAFDLHLADGRHPTIIYFHGNGGTRIFPNETYTALRKYFHVIALDYRSYADSTPAELSEVAVVSDCVQFYKWVQSKTRGKIFVWGHSLGTGISTHTLKKLRDENIIPMGLFLEAPFKTMRDAVISHPLAKIFSWLPYFEATILDPLEKNGFHFRTTKNILKVDCPIFIINAEDDIIIPYMQGFELSKIAQNERDTAIQGEVLYHMFPAHLGYNHMGLARDPYLLILIEKFLEVCNKFRSFKYFPDA